MIHWQLRCGIALSATAILALAPALGAERLNGGDRREPGFLQEIYAGVVTNQTVTFTGLTFRTSADALIANFPPVGMSTLTCLVGVDEALGFYLPVAQ